MAKALDSTFFVLVLLFAFFLVAAEASDDCERDLKARRLEELRQLPPRFYWDLAMWRVGFGASPVEPKWQAPLAQVLERLPIPVMGPRPTTRESILTAMNLQITMMPNDLLPYGDLLKESELARYEAVLRAQNNRDLRLLDRDLSRRLFEEIEVWDQTGAWPPFKNNGLSPFAHFIEGRRALTPLHLQRLYREIGAFSVDLFIEGHPDFAHFPEDHLKMAISQLVEEQQLREGLSSLLIRSFLMSAFLNIRTESPQTLRRAIEHSFSQAEYIHRKGSPRAAGHGEAPEQRRLRTNKNTVTPSSPTARTDSAEVVPTTHSATVQVARPVGTLFVSKEVMESIATLAPHEKKRVEEFLAIARGGAHAVAREVSSNLGSWQPKQLKRMNDTYVVRVNRKYRIGYNLDFRTGDVVILEVSKSFGRNRER